MLAAIFNFIAYVHSIQNISFLTPGLLQLLTQFVHIYQAILLFEVIGQKTEGHYRI